MAESEQSESSTSLIMISGYCIAGHAYTWEEYPLHLLLSLTMMKDSTILTGVVKASGS